MNGAVVVWHGSLTLTTRVGWATSPRASRVTMTDNAAPTPSPVQNGREPSTPSSSPAASLRVQTRVSRLGLKPLSSLGSEGSPAVSTMLSGPRLLALVASGSYPSPAADGLLWKYCGSGLPSLSVNDWPIRLLPTGFPPASMIDPSALSRSPGSWATSQIRRLHFSHSREELDDEVDQLDADERRDDAAEAVDVEVAAQQLRRAARGVAHASQRKRNERDDDDSVEDHGGQDRRLRAVQPHDVQQVEAGEQRHEHRGDDRKVFRDVVGDRERGQRAAGDEQLLADLDDLDELGRV